MKNKIWGCIYLVVYYGFLYDDVNGESYKDVLYFLLYLMVDVYIFKVMFFYF